PVREVVRAGRRRRHDEECWARRAGATGEQTAGRPEPGRRDLGDVGDVKRRKETGMQRRLAVLMIMGVCSAVATGWLLAGPAYASGGGGCGRPVTDARGVHVRIRNFCFGPTVLHVRRGTTVSFTNLDST